MKGKEFELVKEKVLELSRYSNIKGSDLLRLSTYFFEAARVESITLLLESLLEDFRRDIEKELENKEFRDKLLKIKSDIDKKLNFNGESFLIRDK